MHAARRLAIAGFAGSFFAPPALAQLQYECTVVDAFAPSYSLRETYIWDINESGLAPGLTTLATTLPGGSTSIGYTGFYWTPSGQTAVSLSDPRAVNDAGLIAGQGFILDSHSSTFTPMPALAGWTNIRLTGINNAATVVGHVVICNCSNSNQMSQIPYIWDAVSGARTTTIPDARELLRINNSGLAVGNIRGSSTNGFIVDTASGSVTLLNSFMVANSATSMADINDRGVALGQTASASNFTQRAFLYSPATGVSYLPPAPAGFMPDLTPRGLNRANTVVGWMSGTNPGARAFVWDDQLGIRDLNTITANIPAGFVLRRAWRINDQGWIVGDGSGAGAFSKGFVLRPISNSCYANCDGSTATPLLTANDFQCFLNKYAAADSFANCDGSAGSPVLTANDFQCFLNAYATGCR